MDNGKRSFFTLAKIGCRNAISALNVRPSIFIPKSIKLPFYQVQGTWQPLTITLRLLARRTVKRTWLGQVAVWIRRTSKIASYKLDISQLNLDREDNWVGILKGLGHIAANSPPKGDTLFVVSLRTDQQPYVYKLLNRLQLFFDRPDVFFGADSAQLTQDICKFLNRDSVALSDVKLNFSTSVDPQMPASNKRRINSRDKSRALTFLTLLRGAGEPLVFVDYHSLYPQFQDSLLTSLLTWAQGPSRVVTFGLVQEVPGVINLKINADNLQNLIAFAEGCDWVVTRAGSELDLLLDRQKCRVVEVEPNDSIQKLMESPWRQKHLLSPAIPSSDQDQKLGDSSTSLSGGQ